MKFKVTFNQTVTEVQKVEGVIEADTQEAVLDAFHNGDFKRYLVVKKELVEQNIGTPEFTKIG